MWLLWKSNTKVHVNCFTINKIYINVKKDFDPFLIMQLTQLLQ